ncbi:polysaccharide pyruvyl transferase family protein [Microbacterium betulae]|uniref:Polysaccharide pyruvyl transferase family protein n=1 Tax=Microbacterium betulae TaxID=2981139 RepID=A0AA97I491_9MICO|nr:polysaccharide pyruvyl transferase family protein [Microbacterium sp. AB]WOF22366.1 polysaccharide pyruvyl transferase family protein [Microbacterium sp. AB]
MSTKPLRVLESVAAPGRTIKYIDQVVRYAPDDIVFTYFRWTHALLARYDVFHVHWPEFLIRSRKTWARAVQRILFRMLLLRLRLTKTPVVRTQHNLEPHERGDSMERRLLGELERLTTVRVLLNSATAVQPDEVVRVIPHGDYQEELGSFTAAEPRQGRLLFFGRIEPYKSVPALLDAFRDAAEEGDELRIVGKPSATVGAELEARVSAWDRDDAHVALRLEHVSDAEMVQEMTSAEAIVLPYSEMHNSGVVLVALSLRRPVIVPASEANEAIAREVGAGWVIQYEGRFDAEALRNALHQVRESERRAPNLSSRDWRAVAAAYADTFREAARVAAERKQAPVFVNAGGQRDNIGDSLLRRAYLDALRPVGTLHVYAGPDAGYTSGLGLRDGDVVYTSPMAWLLHAGRYALTRRIVLGINTGEVVGTPEEERKGRWQPILARLVSLRGGRVVMAGISLRPGTSAEHTSLSALASRADVVTWRDRWTRDAFGIGDVQPDWAFKLGSERDDWRTHSDRAIVAVAMRGDRPAPADDWYDAVQRVSETTGTRIVVVVQVRRDVDRARQLASRLDAEIVEWSAEDDHAVHERKVRAVYGDAVAVVSDRIHALIVGYTEGAVPLGFSTGSPEKVIRSLKTVASLPFCADDGSASSEEVWLAALAQRETFFSDLTSARATLSGVSASVAALAPGC